MSTDTRWYLRAPADDELQAFTTPIQLAFGAAMSDEELADWLELAEPERWIGAYEHSDSESVVGCASAYSVRLTVPGGEVAAAAVTGIGVRPDHQRRGVLRALMQRQITDVHARGEPVAVLWASEGAIYQRFGYGLGTMDGSFEVSTGRTTFTSEAPVEGRVRIVGETESAELIPAVYEAMRARTPGALSRTESWWTSGVLADPEYGRRGAGPKVRVVFEADGRPEGYAIYRVKEEWDQQGPRAVLEVKEAVTNTPRALRGLWRYLFGVALVRTVKADRIPAPTPLQHLLAEPRALGLITKDGLWVRLVDARAALAARRYGAGGELVLDVADGLCPWNAGRWRVSSDERTGRVEVAPSDATPDLTLDTADLAALYLGGVRPSDLAAAGRIAEVAPGSVARANAMFASDVAPWCVMMF